MIVWREGDQFCQTWRSVLLHDSYVGGRAYSAIPQPDRVALKFMMVDDEIAFIARPIWTRVPSLNMEVSTFIIDAAWSRC